jgi:hypothetical protein
MGRVFHKTNLARRELNDLFSRAGYVVIARKPQ